MVADEVEQHRHRCEVRQVLRWRLEHGREWVREWLAGVAQKRGRAAANALQRDAAEQWQRGNRGGHDEWRRA